MRITHNVNQRHSSDLESVDPADGKAMGNARSTVMSYEHDRDGGRRIARCTLYFCFEGGEERGADGEFVVLRDRDTGAVAGDIRGEYWSGGGKVSN
jgi:hypothetical protein